jgi:AraC-like DNA-binding protein
MNKPTDINFGPIEFEFFQSDNSNYGSEWSGLRLNDDYHRLYFIASGEAQVIYNGVTQPLLAGHIYLFPTTTSFQYSCASQFHLLNICFKMTLQDGLDVLDMHPCAIDVPVVDIATTMNTMTQIDANVLKKSFSHQLAVRGMILTLLSPHFRARETDKNRQRRRDIQRMATVLRHISDNIRGGVAISELPAIAGMSRSHFSKKFHDCFGLSPQNYIRKQRIELVKHELHQSLLPLAVLAEDFGFCSPSHLTREFKQHTGYTPKDFRNLDRYYD